MIKRVVAGVDVGSLYTKTVIMTTDAEILSFSIFKSGYRYREAAEDCLAEALRMSGVELKDIKSIVTTGYGRKLLDFRNCEVTEITCHARGARKLYSQVNTVIDIGGQDSKVILIGDRGEIIRFVMNDKCAAGTGRFLEVMAGSLRVNIDEMGELASRSRKKIEISNMCTVFAESEVIGLLASDEERADIVSGIHRAISRRVAGMIAQVGGLRERVTITGGVARNIGVVRALEEELETSIIVTKEPQIVGALGAALIAAEQSVLRERIPVTG